MTETVLIARIIPIPNLFQSVVLKMHNINLAKLRFNLYSWGHEDRDIEIGWRSGRSG